MLIEKIKVKLTGVSACYVLLFLLVGCSAHNPWIMTNTTDTTKLTEVKYSPHSNKIFITEETIYTKEDFQRIATIQVGKITSGSIETVFESMAQQARELGADAVIEADTWRQASGWSWSAPHGSGIAIKIIEGHSIDFSKLSGKWW